MVCSSATECAECTNVGLIVHRCDSKEAHSWEALVRIGRYRAYMLLYARNATDLSIISKLSEAVGDLEYLAQQAVHASDRVLNDFRRRVPNAQLLAQFRIERFQKRFVEAKFCRHSGFDRSRGFSSLERFLKE